MDVLAGLAGQAPAALPSGGNVPAGGPFAFQPAAPADDFSRGVDTPYGMRAPASQPGRPARGALGGVAQEGVALWQSG